MDTQCGKSDWLHTASLEATKEHKSTSKALIALGSAWFLLVSLGMIALFDYSAEAGVPSSPPPQWPEASTLTLAEDTPTLIMVAHPKCSCTRASIGELARLMTRLRGQLRGYVLFVHPEGAEEDWSQTDLWSSAALIPGIQVIEDVGGEEAKGFRAHTSGATVLYSQSGALLFHGGISPTRSHYGDSVGRRRVIELVTTGDTDRTQSDVYGCGLDGHNSTPSQTEPLP